MGPPSPASTEGDLWLHPAIPSALGIHGQGKGGQNSSQIGLTGAKDNPCFTEIPPIARSMQSWLLCTNRDTERPRTGKDSWSSLLPSGLLPA